MTAWNSNDVEKSIARRAIKELLAAGFALSVNDGEETTLKLSRRPRIIAEAMFSTDQDYLLVHKPLVDGDPNNNFDPDHFGWVRFIYGNDGWDVINDNTVNLEPYLVSTTAYAESFDT